MLPYSLVLLKHAKSVGLIARRENEKLPYSLVLLKHTLKTPFYVEEHEEKLPYSLVLLKRNICGYVAKMDKEYKSTLFLFE